MEYVLVPQSVGASRMVYYIHHCLETLGVVVMPGPPSIESGSTGDTASGKLKKTAVVAALEVSRDAVAELERKGKLKKCLEKTIGESLQRRRDDEDQDHKDAEGKVNSIARGEAIFKYIQASGVEYSTTAAKASRAITDEDSLDRIHTTYQDLEKSLRSATLLDSSRSATAPVDCIPAMTRDVKLTKEKPTGTYVSRCCAWAGDHRNESNSAVDTRIDPDPPKRHIIRVHINQKFHLPSLIVDNGKAWSELADPKRLSLPQSVSSMGRSNWLLGRE
ncbi:hypothetical protein F4604DRAFT_1682449 [Suillus subluteus]|nr:hypothetical protein F4604DRAFT_1682449 [Suillus subluteus]